MWINWREIQKLDFWPKMARVLFLYLMFINVFTNIDQIYNYSWLNQLQDSLNQKFDENSMFMITNGLLDNWSTQTIIITDLEGKTCRQLGSRFGIFLRKVMSVKLHDKEKIY